MFFETSPIYRIVRRYNTALKVLEAQKGAFEAEELSPKVQHGYEHVIHCLETQLEEFDIGLINAHPNHKTQEIIDILKDLYANGHSQEYHTKKLAELIQAVQAEKDNYVTFIQSNSKRGS